MRISDWSSDVCSSDLVAGARRPGMNIAPLRSSIAGLAALRPLDAAETGGERGEDRIKVVDGFLVAADHHAIAALQAPDPARGADVDIADAPGPERFGAPDIVLVEAIAAIADDRSEERRVGKGCGSKCRSRCAPST